MKKNDRIFLGAVFFLLVLAGAGFYFSRGNSGAWVKVTVAGSLYGRYALEENQEIPIIMLFSL